jgi:hypothetical protein
LHLFTNSGIVIHYFRIFIHMIGIRNYE